MFQTEILNLLLRHGGYKVLSVTACWVSTCLSLSAQSQERQAGVIGGWLLCDVNVMVCGGLSLLTCEELAACPESPPDDPT